MFDEDEFRGSGNAVPEAEDISDDWDALRGRLPKYLYRVYEGYGCDSMELWRLHCLGELRIKRYGRYVDHWEYKHDQRLWAGPQADHPHINKIYRIPKHHVSTTLDVAFGEFHRVWFNHVGKARENIQQIEDSIAKYQAQRDRLLGKIELYGSGPSAILDAVLANLHK